MTPSTPFDVQAPGRHVGGDEHGELAVGEVRQGALTVGLAQVAVDGLGLDPLLAEVLHQAVGTALGAHEEQRLLLAAADGRRHLDLVHLVHLQEPVLHEGDGLGVRGHLVEDGVRQVALDQAVDGAVERGGEEQRLVGLVEAARAPTRPGA